MNKEHIQATKDLLRNLPKGVIYDQSAPYVATFGEAPECYACIAGVALAAAAGVTDRAGFAAIAADIARAKDRAFREWKESEDGATAAAYDEKTKRGACEFLGIDTDDADDLFHPCPYGPDDDPDEEQALEALDNLAAGQGDPWP